MCQSFRKQFSNGLFFRTCHEPRFNSEMWIFFYNLSGFAPGVLKSKVADFSFTYKACYHPAFRYHMECLTPPVEFVPLDEWFCPACTSREDAEEEQHEDAELHEREAPRARATRGRPRGSTARRVSSSGRTGLRTMSNFCFVLLQKLYGYYLKELTLNPSQMPPFYFHNQTLS